MVRYGTQQLGLICSDSYRIGAQEQLRTYGKILGVPVHSVQDEASLQATLAGMCAKHLVLIDTVGLAQRDERVSEQTALFRTAPIQRILLLNAACQTETLDDVLGAYGGNGLAGCILTKLDEAVKIGGVLDVIMRHRLALQFIANGQRVPEDLHFPNAELLVHRALKAKTPGPFALNNDEYKLLMPGFVALSEGRPGSRQHA